MKKILAITSLFFMLILFSQCGPTMTDARNYNEELITEQKKVINAIDALENSFSTFNTETISVELEKTKKQLASSITSLEKLGSFDEKTEFYDATMELYKMFEKQLNNEYSEQLEIYKLSDENYTKEKENRFNELSNIIDNEYDIISKKMLSIQQKFVDSWGLELKK